MRCSSMLRDFTGELHPVWTAITRSVFPQDLTSGESLAFVRRSLEVCEREHVSCRLDPRMKNFMPRRVVDVGIVSNERTSLAHGAPVRIVESASIVDGRRYACLSHRWGSAKEMNITNENTYAGNCSGIAFQDLGPAYKDAVLIVRNLGIRYLWVDSLCIVQDSKADWDAESKLMAKIYSGGVITIALQREPGKPASVTKVDLLSHLLGDSCDEPSVYAQTFMPHLWSNYRQFPLLSRGW
jgi:hypothetical protein